MLQIVRVRDSFADRRADDVELEVSSENDRQQIDRGQSGVLARLHYGGAATCMVFVQFVNSRVQPQEWQPMARKNEMIVGDFGFNLPERMEEIAERVSVRQHRCDADIGRYFR